MVHANHAGCNRLGFEALAAVAHQHGLEGRVVNLHALGRGPFVVAICKIFLCGWAGQVFEEFHSRFAVFGVFRHGTASNVQMRAPACLVGKHDAHLVHHGFVFWVGGSHEAGKVVGVGQPNAAFAAGNSFDLIGVAALGRASHIVCHAFEPSLGSGRADMLADGAKQAQVVGMRAAAGAQLAFVFGLAQFFIGVHIVALDTGFVVNHHARTGGKAKPC